jgi:hypothetical protein
MHLLPCCLVSPCYYWHPCLETLFSNELLVLSNKDYIYTSFSKNGLGNYQSLLAIMNSPILCLTQYLQVDWCTTIMHCSLSQFLSMPYDLYLHPPYNLNLPSSYDSKLLLPYDLSLLPLYNLSLPLSYDLSLPWMYDFELLPCCDCCMMM